MKKNMLKLSILLIAFMSILNACNKDEAIDLGTDFQNPKEEIGQLHNEQLKFILERVETVPEKSSIVQYVDEIINLQNTNSHKSFVSLSSLPDFPENIEALDLNNWLNEFNISLALKEEVSKTFELFRSAHSLNEILMVIEQKELAAASLFKGTDLDLYYEHLAVAKYTSVFWYPEEEGGLNGIQYLNPTINGSQENRKSVEVVNWWKVLGVDCVGGMMGGPAGYAGASAISAIMQL